MKKPLEFFIHTWITLVIELIFSSALYIILVTRGLSKNTGLLIAFLTLITWIVIINPLLHYIFPLKASLKRTPRKVTASRKNLFRAFTTSGITLALYTLQGKSTPPEQFKTDDLSDVHDWQRDHLLQGLVTALALSKEWYEAERVTRSIENDISRAKALIELAEAFAANEESERAQALLQEAEQIARSIEDVSSRADILIMLAEAYVSSGERGQARALWQEAEQTARSIESINWDHDRVLLELIRTLAQAKEWREAERVAHFIGNDENRIKALSELAEAYVASGERGQARTLWQEAEQIAHSLEYVSWRANALRNLATALAQAKEWQEAERVARSTRNMEKIGDDSYVLKDIVIELAQAKEWQEAERVAHSINYRWCRGSALQELATALAQAKEWQEAERVARSIEDDENRIRAITKLAEACTASGEKRQARALWQEFEQIAHSIESDVTRDSALQELATALAQAKEWQEAERVARSIEDWYHDQALRELATALAQAKEWQEAERVARSIHNEPPREQALQELATAFAANGERERAQAFWQEAEQIALSIPTGADYQEGFQILVALAQALAQAKEWQKAERVAHSIRHDSYRYDALQNLVTALAQAKEWQEAERVARSISPSPPQKKNSSNTSTNPEETIINSLASPEATAIANVITYTTGFAALIGMLGHIAKQWSKKDDTNSTGSHQLSRQTKGTEIVSIRLRMAHDKDHELEEWLSDPERLRHYIDIFNEPSSTLQPLRAIFKQANGTEIKVDVSKGTQNNPQLDEILSYLNIDSMEDTKKQSQKAE